MYFIWPLLIAVLIVLKMLGHISLTWSAIALIAFFPLTIVMLIIGVFVGYAAWEAYR